MLMKILTDALGANEAGETMLDAQHMVLLSLLCAPSKRGSQGTRIAFTRAVRPCKSHS